MSGLCPLARTVTQPAGFEQETGLSLAMHLTAQLAKAQLWQQLPPFAVLASPVHISELWSQLKRLKDKSAPQPHEITEWTLSEDRAWAASVWKGCAILLPDTAALCSQAKFFLILINVHSIFGTT